MSDNALKRITIVLARDNGAFDRSQQLSARAIHRRLETHFPNHHYHLMSVKLYLFRLFQEHLVQARHRGGPPIYRLTPSGYEAAEEYWKVRGELGHYELFQDDVSQTGCGPDHGLLRIAEELASASMPV